MSDLRDFRKTLSVSAAVAVLMAIALAPPVDAATEWYVGSETMTTGTSTGFVNEQTDDGAVNVKTEAATTSGGPYAAMARPNADITVEMDYKHSEPSCTIAGSVHWPYISGSCPGEPDGNTSYIGTTVVAPPGDSTDYDDFATTDLTLPAGAAITSVAGFMWARKNDTYLITLNLYVFDSTGACGVYSPTITQAYANYSMAYSNSCDANAWTAADLADLLIYFSAQYPLPDVGGKSIDITYAGIVVTYTVATDYALDLTSTYQDVAGTSLALVAECTTTEAAEDTLTVTYAGAARGTIACDGVRNHLGLPSNTGTVQVQLSSVTVAGDATQSTYTFDVLVLETTITEDDHWWDAVLPMECHAGIWDVTCTVTLWDTIGVAILATTWSLEGQLLGMGSGGDYVHAITFSRFSLPSANLTVTVRVLLDNGQHITRSTSVVQDNTGILLLMIILTALAVAVLVIRKETGKSKKGKRKRDEGEKEPEENWRIGVFGGARK